MKVKLATRQFGELEFEEKIVYRFPDGLPGFEDLHNFIIISENDTEPLKWLLSIEVPDIGFPILEMSLIMPELRKELPAEYLSACTMFGVVTLNRDPKPATINLKAPIVVNNAAKSGKQVLLNSDKYSTEYKIK